MKKIYSLALVLLLSSCSSVPTEQEGGMMDRMPIQAVNENYISNREPLQPQQFIKLPTGSIRPEGWLRTMLELQRDGLNGHLGEISAWLQKDDNAWLKSGGKWGWEEVPYWLRGYAGLAYLLKDEHLLAETQTWIEAILASQREDGNFGPYTEVDGAQDFWPNMVALWILQSYYEYSSDERVLGFMTRYFHYQLTVPDEKFLESYWENSRGGDNLWSVVWLYNRTGDQELLKLADKLHRNTADWTKSTELPNWHNVNVAQCFREPATYYLFNGDEKYVSASYNVQSLIRRAFGQVPGGMFGADENARMGFFDPRQGTETCGFAEQMASDEIMLLITGDPYWAENCEDVAFNSYPAALMPDMKSLRYITSPNMVMSDSENHKPGIDNAGPFLAMNPFSSRCCQHNHGFAWPYYAEHLVMATPDNGVAAVLFNSCEATVKVADGKEVVIREQTDYPFDSQISFTIASDQAVVFPFYIRIPSWTKDADVKVNGQKVQMDFGSGEYLCLQRTWENGDKIEVNFLMEISYRKWQVNKNSVSVDYGPLTLSLKIKEKYVKKNSTETAIWDSQWQKGADVESWPSYEIYPESSWNYALQLKTGVTLKEKKALAPGVNPFTPENIPLVFQAKGRIVPEWKIDEYKLCGVLPYESAVKSEQVDDIELVPMGAMRLRISAFPTCN